MPDVKKMSDREFADRLRDLPDDVIRLILVEVVLAEDDEADRPIGALANAVAKLTENKTLYADDVELVELAFAELADEVRERARRVEVTT